MESRILFNTFDQETHRASHTNMRPWHDDRYADTYKWAQYGVEMGEVLSPNMLVTETINTASDVDERSRSWTKVYLCFNWRLKKEFILMHKCLETKHSVYTPQYGRDDNYDTRTQGENEYSAFSVEAFGKQQPDLAARIQDL